MGTEYILLCEDCKIIVGLDKVYNHGENKLKDFGLERFLLNHTGHTLRCITDEAMFHRFIFPTVDDKFEELKKWSVYDTEWSDGWHYEKKYCKYIPPERNFWLEKPSEAPTENKEED